MLEVVVQRVGRRHGEIRQVVLVVRNIDAAPLGDPQRVRQRFRHLAEDLLHFLRGLQIELIAVIAQAIAIVDVLAGADAEQDVVRTMIAVRQVVHVVGRDERHVQLARDRHQPLVDDQLLLDALILHLEEEIARPENVAELRGGLERLPLAPGPDFARDFALQAAAEPDQPLRVLREQVFVDARLVVEPLGIACGHELDEVVIALVGLGQQNEVVRRLTNLAALGQPAAGRDVHLAPENRLHAALFGVVVKDHRREHVAVLGHRQRRHLQPRRLVEQLVDAARAIEQGKLGVTMKVNEVLISHWIWGPVSPKADRRRR